MSLKKYFSKKALAVMLAVMITAAPASSVTFAAEEPAGEPVQVQQEVKEEPAEKEAEKPAEKEAEKPAEKEAEKPQAEAAPEKSESPAAESAPAEKQAEAPAQQQAEAPEQKSEAAAPQQSEAPAQQKSESSAPKSEETAVQDKPAKSSYKVTIVLNNVKTASGDSSVTAATATVSAGGSKNYTSTNIKSWVKTKSVYLDGVTYTFTGQLKNSSGNLVSSISIKGADLTDDTTMTYTPVYTAVEDMVVTVNFNNILNAKGEATSSTLSNTLKSGSGWSFTQKKLDNMVPVKSFSSKGVKYKYTGTWVDEDGNEFTSLSVKNTGETNNKVYNISPVYEQTKAQVLKFRYIDNISTGSGSWQNEDEFTTFSHKFKQPEAKDHYKFVEWKNLDNGNTYDPGDTFKYTVDNSLPSGTVTEVNIHAMWQPSVTVEYYGINGLLKSVETTDSSVSAYAYNAADSAEVQNGAEFIGWYEGNDADAERVAEGTEYELPAVTSEKVDQKVIKLYAKFAADYTAEYYLENLDGGYDLAEDETESFKGAVIGSKAEAPEKEFEGFSLDREVEGTLTESDVEAGLVLKFYYSRNTYEVTYAYEGELVPANADEQLPAKATYKYEQEVPEGSIPDISGFEFSGWNGEVDRMPANDVTVVGSWSESKAGVVDENKDEDEDENTMPENDVTIVVDWSENETGAADENKDEDKNTSSAVVAATPAAPAAQSAKSEVISDSAVPMTIADEEMPLAAEGAWALINLLCAIATAIMSLILMAGIFFRREEEDEETGETIETRQNTAARLFSMIPAAGAVIAFLLTENMSNPMVLTDNWTILMAAILMVQVGVAVVSEKRKEKDDEELNSSF